MVKNYFTVAKINRLLLVLFLAVFIYTIYDLVTFVIPRITAMVLKKDAGLVIPKHLPLAEKKEEVGQGPKEQPLSYYLQQIEKRELFKSVIGERAGNASQAGQPAIIKLDDIAKTLTLKGIVAGQPAQAVIEDTKQGKTYFVTKGQTIGQATVEQITDDKVTLKLGEQYFDLTL